MTWQIKKIGELLKLEYGKPLPQDQRNADGLYPVYGANGEKARADNYYFEKQSIIVGRKGSAGELQLTNGKFWPLDVTYYVVFDEKKYDLKFLYYLLYQLQLPKLARGVKPGINRNDVYSIPAPIPNLLAEQQRIVAILDKVFAGIEKAKENAKKNLQNAKELFESYLQSVFANPGKDWEEKPVDEICEIEYGYTEKARNEGEYRFIRITDTDDKGLLTNGNKMYVDAFPEVSKYVLTDGNLLMARTGASAGNVLLFEGHEKAIFASYLIRMTFEKEILNRFYWYFSKSKLYWNQVRQLSTGSAQPQFNGGAVRRIRFPFPSSLSEQNHIVAQFDALSAKTKKLEAIYQQKLLDLEELKKSVLKKAFSGDL